MAIWSDMNEFPESGLPVLADVSERICLGTLYRNPLKSSGFLIDVIGANRLLGALTISGALTGVTSITMAGTLATVTNLTMSGTLQMGSGNLLTLGDIGSLLSRVKKGWFKDLEITNIPTVLGEPVILRQDLARYVPCVGVLSDVDLGSKNLITTGTLGAGATTVTDLTTSGTVQLGNASSDVCTNTGRMVLRTTASDPQDGTPANRPAGTVGEIAYYNAEMYFCTNAATPTWKKITSS